MSNGEFFQIGECNWSFSVDHIVRFRRVIFRDEYHCIGINRFGQQSTIHRGGRTPYTWTGKITFERTWCRCMCLGFCEVVTNKYGIRFVKLFLGECVKFDVTETCAVRCTNAKGECVHRRCLIWNIVTWWSNFHFRTRRWVCWYRTGFLFSSARLRKFALKLGLRTLSPRAQGLRAAWGNPGKGIPCQAPAGWKSTEASGLKACESAA